MTPMNNLTPEQNERFEDFWWETGEYKGRPLGIDQYKLFLASELALARTALIQEIEGMGFADREQAGQFALHVDGYNQAIDDILARIKEHHDHLK